MQKGSLERLEAELDRAEGACRKEQAAVPHELHGSVSRMRRRCGGRLEGAEVHLYLLKHLASSSF